MSDEVETIRTMLAADLVALRRGAPVEELSRPGLGTCRDALTVADAIRLIEQRLAWIDLRSRGRGGVPGADHGAERDLDAGVPVTYADADGRLVEELPDRRVRPADPFP